MAWWIAVFKEPDGSTEELEVSTSTTLQYEAWNKVISMFPNKELLQLNSGDELPASLEEWNSCLLYTSPSPRDVEESRMPSSA